MTKKVLILGATGMVGHVVATHLAGFSEKYELITVARAGVMCNPKHFLDLTDFESLSRLLRIIKPDVVINAVGILNRGFEDPMLSQTINAALPVLLSDLGRDLSFQLIHISTDCVFTGSKGKYLETDNPDAEDIYGISKAQGECIHSEHLVIRTSIIGPEIRLQPIGLFHWFTSQEGEVIGYDQVFWTGVTTLALADAIKMAIENKTSGLLHLVNNQAISKRDLLEIIQRHFPNKIRRVIPTSVPISNKSLVNTRTDFPYSVPSYEAMLRELRIWMERHPQKYGHYLTLT
jgi:dTDP-4-dehydrorhamnose reductase